MFKTPSWTVESLIIDVGPNRHQENSEQASDMFVNQCHCIQYLNIKSYHWFQQKITKSYSHTLICCLCGMKIVLIFSSNDYFESALGNSIRIAHKYGLMAYVRPRSKPDSTYVIWSVVPKHRVLIETKKFWERLLLACRAAKCYIVKRS